MRGKWFLCLAWIVFGLCLSLPAPAREIKVIAPAYFYPGGEGLKYWQQLNAAASRVALWVIINPASGPGERADPNYLAVLKALRAARGKTLAYVDTSYARRPLAGVLEDVDRWLALYPGMADGFFVDQITNDDRPEHLDYLARLYRHIKRKSRKFLVMGNPGTNTLEAYLTRPVCDAMMTFENAASEYAAYRPDDWTRRHRPDRFAHILHSAPASGEFLTTAVQTARERGAGWLYITDAVFNKQHPNPYDRLPVYWEQEIEAIRNLARPTRQSPR